MSSERAENEISIDEISLNADIDSLKRLKDIGSQYAQNNILDKERLFFYIFCLDEIFVNCIRHAYNSEGGRVDIKFYKIGRYFATKIRDYGKGIDQKYVRQIPVIDENNMDKYGRGLFLVNSFSDRLKVKNKKIGTEISFYFRRI